MVLWLKNLFSFKFNFINFLFNFNFLNYFKFLYFFLTSTIKLKFIFKTIKLNNKKIVNNNIISVFNNFFFLDQNFFNKNYYFNKNIINIIYNFNLNKLNYLVFDNNKYIHNLYLNMYSFKNLLINKKYFYINPKYFTHKNFIYFYNKFLIDNNIHLIFIFNAKNILKYVHILESFNIVLFFFDFYNNFYNSSINILFKDLIYYYILIFNFCWLFFLNYSNYKNKIFFFKNFLKIKN